MADDLFMDNERLQKMIALGIYDDKTVDKMKNIKNSDFTDTTTNRPSAADRPPQRPPPEQPTPPYQTLGRRPMNSGRALVVQNEDNWRPPNKYHGFRPLANSAFKWSELGNNKRQRSPSDDQNSDEFRDRFRSGIRDGIQTKIQRNEMETKLNEDFNKDNTFGNSSNDSDLRPKSDTDSRLRDTDSPYSLAFNRKTADNLLITSTANDEDFRTRDNGSGDQRGGRMGANQRPFRGNQRSFRGNQRPDYSGNNADPFDDIDAFIAKTSRKLHLKPSPQKSRPDYQSRGRGSDRMHNPLQQRPDRSSEFQGRGTDHSSDPLQGSDRGFDRNQDYNRPNPSFEEKKAYIPQNTSNESYNRVTEEPKIAANDESEPDPSKHIAILRETVEELSKSNLFCQYCDIYLSSLVEVNSHIGTGIHQQNMAKKIMEDNNSKSSTHTHQPSDDKPKQSEQNERSVNKTVVERVPTGMAALVRMIEQRKQITLKSLTEMDSYDITSDSEAALAKELAKLLTNELLNYKMNLMPDNVKEALKHQGIGLLNTVANN